jgi:RimJ/RimL family protein N-acetyltransferase
MQIIRTPRLIIKSLQVDDITNNYIEWLNDVEVNKYLETRFQMQNYQSCLDFVNRIHKDEREELFGIFTNNNNEHIGNCKLGFISKLHHTAEISFFIGNKIFWGEGYATEVVSHVVQYGFEHLGLVKITAGCYESNKGSKKVLLKAGFEVEGFRKKQVMLGNQREGVYILGVVKK